MTWTDKLTAKINGLNMAWVERGVGDPIVFLHGNPTSSYLWRNVMPHLEKLGHCIAPDLIGMGDSDKLSDPRSSRYRFKEHREYLDALLDHVGATERVTLIMHDWGSALGFDWANRHRESIVGLAYMEGIVCPLGWNDWPVSSGPIFKGIRSEAGEELILDRNIFIERILPQSILRHLTEEEMNEYRRPFADPGEDRRPMLSWPREIPIEGEPEDVVGIVQSYAEWLSKADVPKLFINAEPGAILVGRQREFCRNWPNQLEVTVPGIHFIQEDSPDQIGHTISDWIKNMT